MMLRNGFYQSPTPFCGLLGAAPRRGLIQVENGRSLVAVRLFGGVMQEEIVRLDSEARAGELRAVVRLLAALVKIPPDERRARRGGVGVG